MIDNNAMNPQDDSRQADTDKIYLTDDSTLQTPEEHETDKNRPASDEEETIMTNTLRDSDIDDVAGSDRAGTSERKG